MRSSIQQSVVLPAAPAELFAMYLDTAAHAAITGKPVTIGGEPGSTFQAFDGMLSGSILAVVEPHLIVQSWRSVKFNPDDPDSTLILSFSPEGQAGRIDLIHLDVPEHDYADVVKGWGTHYWTPWRAYLEQRK